MAQDAYAPVVWEEVLKLLEQAAIHRPADMELQEQLHVLQGMLQAHHALAVGDDLAAWDAVAQVRLAHPVLYDTQSRDWWRHGLEFLEYQARHQELEWAATLFARLAAEETADP